MLPELTEFVPATRMGIARKVLLGLKIRAGCIFSLLLNAFEWHLRFKIWNWVGTLSFHGTVVSFSWWNTGSIWLADRKGSNIRFLHNLKTSPRLRIFYLLFSYEAIHISQFRCFEIKNKPYQSLFFLNKHYLLLFVITAWIYIVKRGASCPDSDFCIVKSSLLIFIDMLRCCISFLF